MADSAPAAKRAKRDKFAFDSSTDDDITVIKNMEMDTDSDIFTSDESEFNCSSHSSNHGENLNRKPLLLKVPRGKTTIPESVKNPGATVFSDKHQNDISQEQFKALSSMPLDHICVFAETSKVFKEIALKFFPMKYRNMNLAELINPATGKLSLFMCQFL